MDIIDLHTMKKTESCGSPYSDVQKNLTIALGSFDGVHLGHAALLNTAVKNAKENNRCSAVWTFVESPSVLPEKNGMRSITTLSDKIELFASIGIDYVILSKFSDVRLFSPEKFVKDILIDACGAKAVVCGFNYTFGKGGLGTPKLLKDIFGDECKVLSPITVDSVPISSSLIRSLIENGDTENAAKLLGREFFINSPVVHGKALGRTIGLPTVNQNFPPELIIPKHGIYASRVIIDGKAYVGVSNVGIRPTVDDSNKVNCETHIIGYDGWLYGRKIKVGFSKRLRDEMKFPNIELLKEQIEADALKAIEYFKNK